MDFNIRELKEAIGNKRFYVYGIGEFARKLLLLLDYEHRNNILGFIVSKKQEDFFWGKKVIAVDEVRKCYSGELVVIAVSRKYQEEIFCELLNQSITNSIYLTTFEICQNTLIEQYQDLNDDEFIYMLSSNNSAISEKELFSRINNYEDTKKTNQIVFLIGLEQSLPRHLKQAHALINAGYEIIILHYSFNVSSMFESEKEKMKIEYCNSFESLVLKMLEYNPLVYYFEPEWGQFEWLNLIIQRKKMFGKIVLTLYDVFNDGYLFATNEQKKMEKYALLNCDGMVWRQLAKETLEEQGIVLHQPNIIFYDCCNRVEIKEEKKQKHNEDILKICFVVGNLNVFLSEHKESMDGYSVHAKLDDVLEAFADSKCKFDVYVYYMGNDQKNLIEELKNKYNFLGVKCGLNHEEMMKHLECYDYGIILYSGGNDVPLYESRDGRYMGCVFNDVVANKYFDYIEAGLGIITDKPTKLCSVLSEYNVITNMNLDTLNIRKLNDCKTMYKMNAIRAREEFDINNRINDLIKLFNEV